MMSIPFPLHAFPADFCHRRRHGVSDLGGGPSGGLGPFGWASGFGPGPHHGWYPGRRGWHGGHRGRGSRRGNVRAAVLSLLAEGPRHGYAIMSEIAERSKGFWRPSPGSVYPVLQQLQDEGLVSVEEAEGRRVFALTAAGREYVDSHASEMDEPWKLGDEAPVARMMTVVDAVQALNVAAEQVARTGNDAQIEQAVAAIDSVRKALYRILADDDQ
jgi:DNA-binding PadR family transcriptional regulator